MYFFQCCKNSRVEVDSGEWPKAKGFGLNVHAVTNKWKFNYSITEQRSAAPSNYCTPEPTMPQQLVSEQQSIIRLHALSTTVKEQYSKLHYVRLRFLDTVHDRK